MVITVRMVIKLYRRGRRKLSKVMKIFNILIWVVGTWVYILIKFTKLYT